MKVKEIIEKLKKELPDFNWKEEDNELTTSLACAYIAVEDWRNILVIPGIVKVRMVEHLERENLLKDVNDFKEKIGLTSDNFWNDEEIQLNDDVNDDTLDSIIAGLRLWKEGIDKLRKSDVDEDQLIIIHPDWNLEDFEKDFKFISGDKDDYDHRIGIMSTKDWDFSNDDLCRELQENSGDCFAIGPEEGDEEDYNSEEETTNNYPHPIIDYGLEEAYDELRAKYPEIDNITAYYGTDFD